MDYWKNKLGFGTTTPEPCLEIAEDGTCLGEVIELQDDNYEFKHFLTGPKSSCQSGSRAGHDGRCRKVVKS
jgi:hypothetical protein